MWILTYSIEGKKQVEVVGADKVETLEPLVSRGREYRDGVAEVLALNAQLVTLWLREQRAAKRKRAQATKQG